MQARRCRMIPVVLAIVSTPVLAGGLPVGYTVEAEVVWKTPLEHAGKCSPRAADFNADGFDDVVVGAGFEGHWGEVAALDGKTGQILWRRRVADEVLTTLPFLDVDGDRTVDVVVVGRKTLRDVLLLSGKDGKTIWLLTGANPDVKFLPVNFMNVLPIDDRNGDGRPDLFVVQSGGNDTLRPAARFYVVDSASGKILASSVTPDGQESYALPLFQARSGAPQRFYIGTGGELLSGSLIRLRFPALEEQWRVRAVGGGVIGSPVLVDLEGDGRDELLATAMNGAVYCVDAETGALRWRWRERPFWTYATPAAGAFDDGPALGVVAGFNRGGWPRRDQAKLVWLDGASGRVISEKEFGARSRSTASSPLVLDLDLDGRDETLIVLSNPVPDATVTDESHQLLILDGGAERREVLNLELEGYSIATPRLADLDGDGKLDIVHASHYGVMRIELTVAKPDAPPHGPELPRVRWGEFRGPRGSGIYPPSR